MTTLVVAFLFSVLVGVFVCNLFVFHLLWCRSTCMCPSLFCRPVHDGTATERHYQ